MDLSNYNFYASDCARKLDEISRLIESITKANL